MAITELIQRLLKFTWQYNYPIVIGGVGLGNLLLYWRLKKSGWL